MVEKKNLGLYQPGELHDCQGGKRFAREGGDSSKSGAQGEVSEKSTWRVYRGNNIKEKSKEGRYA